MSQKQNESPKINRPENGVAPVVTVEKNPNFNPWITNPDATGAKPGLQAPAKKKIAP
jgi:hypothetical protein